METEIIDWYHTKTAVREFEELLTCSICKSILADACSLQSCEHVFCRSCITSAIDATGRCPECGIFSWLKDIKGNHELINIIDACKQLKELLISDRNNKDDSNVDSIQSELPLEPPLSASAAHTFQFSEVDNTENTENEEPPVKETVDANSPIGWSQLGTRKGQKKPNKTYGKKDMQEKDKSIKRPSPRETKESNKKKSSKIDLDSKKRKTEEQFQAITTKVKSGVTTPQNKSSTRFTKITPRSVKRKNAKGETLLHAAAIKGDLAECKKLLQCGADPNASDNARWTPLHEACNHGHLEIARELLENGAHIGIQGFENDTPLHDAVANNQYEVAKFLLDHYAPLNAVNTNGLKPIDYAVTDQMKVLFANAKGNEEETVDERPTVLSNPGKQYVLLTTGLSQTEKKLVQECANNLNAIVQDNFNVEVTHIISGVNSSNCCPRTLKYLKAVLTGKWIVNFKWIQNCIRENAWVLEDEYVVDGTKDDKGIPLKSMKNYKNKNPPLLSGCSFFLYGEFKQPAPSKDDLQHLIQLGGGTILHTQPNATEHPLLKGSSSRLVSTRTRPQQQTDAPLPVAYHADDANSLCTQFTLFDSKSTSPPNPVLTPLMATVNNTWIMDCIAQFKILPADNYNK